MQPDEFKKRSLRAAIGVFRALANRIGKRGLTGDAAECEAVADKVSELEAELEALEAQCANDY